MRNFSSYTYDFYLRKTKEMIRYFDKPMEEVTIEELRNFLYIHLLQEKKVADKTVNHYNSVIRFVEEVTLDKLINDNCVFFKRDVADEFVPTDIVETFDKPKLYFCYIN